MDHWHDDTTREAFVAEAEGEANFVQTAFGEITPRFPLGDLGPACIRALSLWPVIQRNGLLPSEMPYDGKHE